MPTYYYYYYTACTVCMYMYSYRIRCTHVIILYVLYIILINGNNNKNKFSYVSIHAVNTARYTCGVHNNIMYTCTARLIDVGASHISQVHKYT